MTQAFPLQWPDGWPRTPAHHREDGRTRFASATGGSAVKRPIRLGAARDGLIAELERLGAQNIVMSTDLKLRQDSLPYANQRQPDDPGIAVYFQRGTDSKVMARDAFDRIEDNMRSLTLAIQGLRMLQRHGGGQMLEKAFAGFTALPPPDAMSDVRQSAWWMVLGVSPDATSGVIRQAYKDKARAAGGATVELNAAKTDGLMARGKD